MVGPPSLAAQESVLITQMFQQDKHFFPLKFLGEAIGFSFTLEAMPPLFSYVSALKISSYLFVKLLSLSPAELL